MARKKSVTREIAKKNTIKGSDFAPIGVEPLFSYAEVKKNDNA